MQNVPPELIVEAQASKIVEELLELAKENNVEMTEEEAKTYFAQLNANGVVSDDELDTVAGGCGPDEESTPSDSPAVKGRCSECGCTEIIFQFYLGNKIYKCKKCNALIENTIDKRAL